MNATMNGSSCSSLINPTAQKIGETIAFCLIFVVSLLGNSFIGFIVYKTESMRKPINFFIVNMAMSDLLYPIFMFPWGLTNLYVDSWLISGPLGHLLCKLIPFVVNSSMIVSIQSLVLIAVDRFGAVVFPLRSPLIKSKRCPFFILGTWIVAMAVFSPYLFALKLVENPAGKQLCRLQWNEVFGDSSSQANYLISTFVVFIFIPTALLVILYSIILIKLKIQKIPGDQLVNARERCARRNRNAIKMAIAIVLVFVLCWVPLKIISLLMYFAWNKSLPYCEHVLYQNIAFFLSVSNCAMNPCICFIFNGNYRRGLKRLFKCSW